MCKSSSTVATWKPLKPMVFKSRKPWSTRKHVWNSKWWMSFTMQERKRLFTKCSQFVLLGCMLRWFFYQPTAAPQALKPSLITVLAWEIKHIFTAISDWLANLEWLHLCISTDLFLLRWQMSQFYQMSKQVATLVTFNIHVRNCITGRSYFFKKVVQ